MTLPNLCGHIRNNHHISRTQRLSFRSEELNDAPFFARYTEDSGKLEDDVLCQCPALQLACEADS